MPRILLIEDDPELREVMGSLFRLEGYDYEAFPEGSEGLKRFQEIPADLVITDLKLPGLSGIDVLTGIKEVDPETPVIIITAYGTPETAVEALKKGAFDYILKPFDVEELKLIIRKALESTSLKRENILLKQQLRVKYGFDNIIGTSREMLQIFELIRRIKDLKTNVLILGESGTGKELVARSIHYNSDRKDKPFVAINCGAIPEALLESELFGHKKGAFTGAIINKDGLLKIADKGTVFFDEIAELPLHLQVKLLRFLQDRTFTPVGSTETETVNVRVIAASNRDLETEVIEGRFREDLFYRLNVVQINLPPLRARKEDIPLLANYFLEKYSKELNKNIKRISNEAMEYLMKYPFPGNVRELENAIERAIALETTDTILPENLPRNITGYQQKVGNGMPKLPDEGLDLEKTLNDIEKNLLLQAIGRSRRIDDAAKLLNLSQRALRYKLQKYGIDLKKLK
jgi:two-component system response regulator PilR (NtrC family)